MTALIPTGNLRAMVRLADVAEPEPAPDEAIVSVEAFSLNRGETFLLESPKSGWRVGRRRFADDRTVEARGLVVWFGQAGRVPPTIDFFSFFDRHQSATIRHFDYTDSDVPDGVDLATLVRLTHTGRLHPEIGSVSAWENAASLIADLRARRIRGKAILQLDPRNN